MIAEHNSLSRHPSLSSPAANSAEAASRSRKLVLEALLPRSSDMAAARVATVTAALLVLALCLLTAPSVGASARNGVHRPTLL